MLQNLYKQLLPQLVNEAGFMANNLKHFRKFLNTSDTHVGNSEIIERGKIRMAKWFCIVAIGIACLYQPLFFTISILVGIFGLIAILILSWCLNQLRKGRDPEPIFKYVFSILLFFILTAMIFQTPINPLGYILWSLLIIASAPFLIDRGWAVGYFCLTFIAFSIVCYFHHVGFNLRESITNMPFQDTSKLNFYSTIKFGIPLLSIFIVIVEYVRINRETDKELLDQLNDKSKLLEQITEKENDLESILNSTGEAIYALNNKGHMVFANVEFENMTGYSMSELEEIDVHFLVEDRFRKKRLNAVYNQMNSRINVSFDQFPIKNKAGELVWLGQYTNMIFDENGKMVRGVCTARDISKQKEIEDKLLFAKEKAEEASLAKARFLSSMSHEIRTPMNAIIGMIDLMECDEKNSDTIESLRFSAHNLLGLVNNILNYNELDEGKVKLLKIEFNLKDMLRRLRHSLEEGANQKQIQLDFEVDDNLPSKLYGDPLCLSQILYNLIDNAIKFTHTGKVSVKVETHAQCNEKIELQFSVIDTGKGIPKEKHESIFDEFKQANSSTIRDGAGLGLAISSKLLKLHNSRMQIESEPSKGSKFHFTIAFKKQPQTIYSPSETIATFSSQDAKPLEGVRILLVEDNLINQKITNKMLLNWGAKVAIAGNGKIAVEKAEQEHFDLILMDLQMPVLNGIEATKLIRAKGGYFEQLPIIALTASAVLKIKEEALASGLDYFITKPFRPDFLFEQIQSHLKLSQHSSVK